MDPQDNAASQPLAKFARHTLPRLTQHVVVRVILTRMPPAACSSVRSRTATRRFTEASRWPVTTPEVPPPSLILRAAEPGPIGSIPRLAIRS